MQIPPKPRPGFIAPPPSHPEYCGGLEIMKRPREVGDAFCGWILPEQNPFIARQIVAQSSFMTADTIEKMKSFVIVMSLVGFAVSASIHICALMGFLLGGEVLLWTCFIGSMLLGGFAIFIYNSSNASADAEFTLRGSILHCPLTVKVLYYLVSVYAILNFLILLLGGVPMHYDSKMTLTPDIARGFSGHAAYFYFGWFSMTLSICRRDRELSDDVCNGRT